MTKLQSRLKKAGIEPGEFAELVWPFLKPKVEEIVKTAERDEILAAVVSGLCVGWTPEESATKLAQRAERIADAVMREEERRTGV